MLSNKYSIILLLLQCFYTSHALLSWRPQTIPYDELRKAFVEAVEISDKPNLSKPEIRRPVEVPANIRALFSRENRDYYQKQQEFIPNHPVRSPNEPRKINPLCFFSALPCSNRRKGVYYVPQKYADSENKMMW